MSIVRVKVFSSPDELPLEKSINKFLEEKDVHFLNLTCSNTCHTIVITYNKKEESLFEGLGK